MNGHHPSTTPAPDRAPMFPALSLMEKRPELRPLRNGWDPFFRAPIPMPAREFYGPSWNWTAPRELAAGAQLLTLDTNGAYLAALGGVRIAHSQLSHTGPWDGIVSPRDVLPGYYRIAVPPWAFSGTIVSPLGNSARLETEDTVWIAAPTLVLLAELAESGHLAELHVVDSYTARMVTSFHGWYSHLKALREQLLANVAAAHTDTARAVAEDRYAAFKEGYSAALSMMLTGEKCKTRRPDWAHSVYAQHAASQWRKAWRWTATRKHLVSMGHTDEITVHAEDLPEVMSRKGAPPFRYDPTGVTLGALKPKPEATAPAPAPAAEDDDTEGDIL